MKNGLKPEHSNGRDWMQRVTVQFMPKRIRNRNKLTVQWFDDIEVLNNFLCKNYMSSLIFVNDIIIVDRLAMAIRWWDKATREKPNWIGKNIGMFFISKYCLTRKGRRRF